MDEDIFKVLEFGKVLQMLEERATSAYGKELAFSLAPSADFDEVMRRLKETGDAVKILAFAEPPLGGIRDLRSHLKKISLGAFLTLDELGDFVESLYAMRNIKKFFKETETELTILKDKALGIEILGQLERRLSLTLDEHGAIRDDASVELMRIRREKRRAEGEAKETMSAILHDPNNQKYFQEAIVSVRGDRYVIPVKQEYRHAFPGIVHDQSKAGATLFIEPLRIVELGNDIKELALLEIQEINRILRSISAEIGKNIDPLVSNCRIMAELDFAFAKGKLANDLRACFPKISDDCRQVLFSARHPLIPEKSVQPIDISIGDGFSMLLISGPNTGGKTVSMKTLGLIVLMNQSGLFSPVDPSSEMGIYQNIYADIGDEQSIETSLSTFSSHMVSIIKILKKAQKGDLVLFDELGAGTDPEEGSALAKAILSCLLERGVHTVTTTHYSELKNFAARTDGIENACVEFDPDSLKPTYRILMGLPGTSRALTIAERLGISPEIIKNATGYIREGHASFEETAANLEKERVKYRRLNEELKRKTQEAKNHEEKLRDAKEKLVREKGEIIKKAREEAATLLRHTRREAEEIIKALREEFTDGGFKKRQHNIDAARARLSSAEDRARPLILTPKGVGKRLDIKKVSPGDTVYVISLGQQGTVVEVGEKEITAQVGEFRMHLAPKECRYLGTVRDGRVATQAQDAPFIAEHKSVQTETVLAKTQSIKPEIDIRGLMVNEAESVLGKFIDDAVLGGLNEILIIHGKGTGALAKGVQDYLKSHPNIAAYHFADINEGGYGATVASIG